MSKVLIAALGAVLFVGIGCQQDKNKPTTRMSDGQMSVDDCPHCPGNQVADANGKCPMCGMKVK